MFYNHEFYLMYNYLKKRYGDAMLEGAFTELVKYKNTKKIDSESSGDLYFIKESIEPRLKTAIIELTNRGIFKWAKEWEWASATKDF